jgi:hypothetical protein
MNTSGPGRKLLAILPLAFMLAVGVASSGFAAGSCPSSKNGKCPTKVSKHDSRNQFTAEQREKMAVEFRKLCKKKYGAPSRLVKVDYYKRRFICSEPGY